MEKTAEKHTKYEIARILGARALQIAMNAPMLIDIKKDRLEELNYDPLKIAEIEFNAGVLPITVRRPFPQKEEIEEEKEAAEIEVIGEEGEIKPEEEKPAKPEEAVKEAEEEEEEADSETITDEI